MCETFGQYPSRSIFGWFLIFMNCYNEFFHVILDWKLNVSDTAQSLYTRIVWCCADVWNFWAKSEAFNFQKVSHLHELLLHVFPCYSWSKIECLRYFWQFIYALWPNFHNFQLFDTSKTTPGLRRSNPCFHWTLCWSRCQKDCLDEICSIVSEFSKTLI